MAPNYLSNLVGVYEDCQKPAEIIAGCFVVIALTFSLFLILQHLRSYTNPAEQKWIVVVIFMVPVYATESIISLCNPRLSLACDILRSLYEAFALYSFGRYLIACLGGERRVVELLENESGKESKDLRKSLLEGSDKNCNVQERPLYNFLWHPSATGKDLLSIEKFGLVQYMILKTLCAFLAFLLEHFGVYGDGEFKWHYGYPYMAVVLNFSQMWALYCLVQFYNVTHEQLEPIKPLSKFISFKAIVFASWWQGIGIALLCEFGMPLKEEKGKNGLQDFLICVEMAIASVAHTRAFSAKPYTFLPSSPHGKVTKETVEGSVKSNDEAEEKRAVVEEKETQVEAPGTSIKGSVQDIVVEGGQRIVKDVVLTISQAMGPMEQGVMRIQQTFQRKSEAPEEPESVEVRKEVTGNHTGDEIKIDVMKNH